MTKKLINNIEKSFEQMKDEFIQTFADSGVVFSPEEIDIIFHIYSNKITNLVKVLDIGNNTMLNETKKENNNETEIH